MKKIAFSLCSFFGIFVFAQNVCAQASFDDNTAAGLVFAMLCLVPLLFVGFIFLVAILGTVFWIWMIIDAAQNEKDNDLLVWILIIVLLHFIGALVYFLARRIPRYKECKKQSVVNQSNT